jgi:hypothetical protein
LQCPTLKARSPGTTSVFTTLLQGNFGEAERAHRRGIRLAEQAATGRGTLGLVLLNLGERYLQAGGRADGRDACLSLTEES